MTSTHIREFVYFKRLSLENYQRESSRQDTSETTTRPLHALQASFFRSHPPTTAKEELGAVVRGRSCMCRAGSVPEGGRIGPTYRLWGYGERRAGKKPDRARLWSGQLRSRDQNGKLVSRCLALCLKAGRPRAKPGDFIKGEGAGERQARIKGKGERGGKRRGEGWEGRGGGSGGDPRILRKLLWGVSDAHSHPT